MKINNKVLAALGIIAVSACIYSCNKDKITKSVNPTTEQVLSSTAITTLDNDCGTCCMGTQVSDVPGNTVTLANVGNYAAWGTVYDTLCNGPQISLTGHFNSFFTNTATGWNVGYLDGVSINAGLDTLDCSTIFGALQPATNNIIGSDDYPNDGDPGYYSYVVPGGYTAYRLIALWKCCGENQVKVYIIKVTDIAYTYAIGVGFTSHMYYDYHCYTCTTACPSFESAAAKQSAKAAISHPDVDANKLLKAFHKLN